MRALKRVEEHLEECLIGQDLSTVLSLLKEAKNDINKCKGNIERVRTSWCGIELSNNVYENIVECNINRNVMSVFETNNQGTCVVNDENNEKIQIMYN